jgi:hypothetical protein
VEKKWLKTLDQVRLNSKKLIKTLACNGIILLKPFKFQRITTGADTDRRHNRRMRSDKSIFILNEGMQDSPAYLLDISITGMYVETDLLLEEGQEIKLSLHKQRPLLHHAITGRVIRKAPHGMAIQFV